MICKDKFQEFHNGSVMGEALCEGFVGVLAHRPARWIGGQVLVPTVFLRIGRQGRPLCRPCRPADAQEHRPSQSSGSQGPQTATLRKTTELPQGSPPVTDAIWDFRVLACCASCPSVSTTCAKAPRRCIMPHLNTWTGFWPPCSVEPRKAPHGKNETPRHTLCALLPSGRLFPRRAGRPRAGMA
jgi:hypothetical protein